MRLVTAVAAAYLVCAPAHAQESSVPESRWKLSGGNVLEAQPDLNFRLPLPQSEPFESKRAQEVRMVQRGMRTRSSRNLGEFPLDQDVDLRFFSQKQLWRNPDASRRTRLFASLTLKL